MKKTINIIADNARTFFGCATLFTFLGATDHRGLWIMSAVALWIASAIIYNYTK